MQARQGCEAFHAVVDQALRKQLFRYRGLDPGVQAVVKQQLGVGMSGIETGRRDFKGLVALAVKAGPPCRAKVHLAKYRDDKFATAIIYPAEYDDEISLWLLDGEYKTSGAAEGGIDAVQTYYDVKPQILDRHQLFGKSTSENRTGEELLAGIKLAIQR